MEKDNLTPSEKLNKLKEVLFAHRKADKDEGEKEVVAQGGSNKNPEIQDGPKQELEAGEKKLISEDSVAAAAKVPFKKRYHQGNYTGAAKHIEKKYGSKVLNHPKVKDALKQANESKMATKDHDGDGKVETSTAEYKGSKDKAIKNALAKRKDANDKAMKTGFMKMPDYVKKKFDESTASWEATKEAEKMARLSKGDQQKISQIRSMLDKEKKAKPQSEEVKPGEYIGTSGVKMSKHKIKAKLGKPEPITGKPKSVNKEKPGEYIGTSGVKMSKHKIKAKLGKPEPIGEDNIQEISDKMKVNYINKAKEQITDREKHGTSSVDKDQILKRRMGIRKATGKLGEDNIQEISQNLANKVTKQRKLNVTKTMMDADGDHRDPDYAKAKQKLSKNQSLNFSRGARRISKAFDGKKLGEATQRLQEVSDALKKRYIAKANKQITSKEKMKDYQLGQMDKQKDKPASLPREKFTKADKAFVKNKYDKEINKRREGVRQARSKLGEDNIQEISKDLASRYIKRAVGDAISNADKTQYHVSKSMQKKAAHKHADTPAKKAKLTKGANKHFDTSRESSRKTMNRFYGIQRAAGKLNKNDKDKGEYLGHSMTKQKTSSKIKAEEMVNELRKSTLSNYIKKAGKQYDDGENALHKGYPEKPIYKMQDKRAKGMSMAGKKLAKKITTSEELQMRLDELKRRLDPKCWDGYKKQGTKKKGDTIVNNCVKESSAAKAAADARRDMKRDSKGLADVKKAKDNDKAYNPSKDKSPPHIINQLQKAVSLGDKHDGVKFKDGKTHKVKAKHAQGFINKYMSSKPADKERMQSHGHESHKNFKTHL